MLVLYRADPPGKMKKPKIITLCLSLLSVPFSYAQVGPFDYIPLKIHQTVEATYPLAMVNAGVRDGIATIAVAVDEKGQLADYILTAYTNPEFAESALAALKKWTFEPARINGAARNSKVDLTFRFKVDGIVVVSMDVMLYNELLRYRIIPNCDLYTACTLSQLDRAPSPVKVVNPSYPEQLAQASKGGHVRVEFYIDELGHVRIPSVNTEAIRLNEDLAASAISAIAQWEFSPPTSKGKPVVVLAQQDFNFKPRSL